MAIADSINIFLLPHNQIYDKDIEEIQSQQLHKLIGLYERINRKVFDCFKLCFYFLLFFGGVWSGYRKTKFSLCWKTQISRLCIT